MIIFRKIFFVLSFMVFAVLSACMTAPTGLNLSLDRPTDHQKYLMKLHSLVEPIAINKMHAWEIYLRTPSGKPVLGASISVGGGMPQHGHGFPTQPRVTKELGDGRYVIEGMKFSMSGWWEIKLKVVAGLGTDEITFNTVISPRSTQLAVASNAIQR
jgi:hypothetical protein